jgi:hypothetical protein
MVAGLFHEESLALQSQLRTSYSQKASIETGVDIEPLVSGSKPIQKPVFF